MNSTLETEYFLIPQRQIAAVLVFIVGFCGTACNLTVGIFTRKLRSMNNSFGHLIGSQALGEAILCAVFAFYFAPMVFFEIAIMEEQSKHAGWLCLVVYDVCLWSHLFIAVNRMCALCMPFSYANIFSTRTVRLLIATSWAIPIVTAIVLYKIYTCDLFYLPLFWAFVFTQNEDCDFISNELDFYKDIIIVIIIAALDLVAILKVQITTKWYALNYRTSETSTQNMRKRRREINFLKQVILQGLLFVVGLFSYFILAWKMPTKWGTFMLTSFAWPLVHTIDGVVILVFNGEFRRLLTNPCRGEHKDKGSSFSHIPGPKPSAVQSVADPKRSGRQTEEIKPALISAP